MYPHQYRLRDSQQITHTLAHGKSINTPLFRLVYANPEATLSAHIAVIISKKKLKKAIDRNRVKRRLRHALHPHLPHLTNQNLVFIIHPTLLSIPYLDLTTHLRQSLLRAHLIPSP